MEADGEEEPEGQRHAGHRGDPHPEAYQHAQPDGHLAQGDDQPDGRSDGHQVGEQAVDGASMFGPDQLGVDRGRAGVRKKSGLASFWSPAKRKVTPRKSRRGTRNHPVAMVPSGLRSAHKSTGSGPTGIVPAPSDAAGACDAFEVTGSIPWPGTLPAAG